MILGVTTIEVTRDIGGGWHPVTFSKKRLEANEIVIFGVYSNIDGPVNEKHSAFPKFGV